MATGTASNALSGRPSVAPELRARVIEAARKPNHRPNVVAAKRREPRVREGAKGRPSRTASSRPTPAYLRPFSGTFEPPAPASASVPLACFPLSIDSAEEAAHDIQREAMGRPSRSNVVARRVRTKSARMSRDSTFP